jgi:hypothetical protein
MMPKVRVEVVEKAWIGAIQFLFFIFMKPRLFSCDMKGSEV